LGLGKERRAGNGIGSNAIHLVEAVEWMLLAKANNEALKANLILLLVRWWFLRHARGQLVLDKE
jgi:hypothetical protein